jgi:hypothetical protein
MELPEDKDRFDQGVNIIGNGIAMVFYLYKISIDSFGNDSYNDQQKKGLVAITDTATAYQPCTKRNYDRKTDQE